MSEPLYDVGHFPYEPGYQGEPWQDKNKAYPPSAARLARIRDQLAGLTDRFEHGSPAAPTATQASLGTTLGSTSMDAAGVLNVAYSTVWGIDATGQPYYDSAGAAAGQEAVLLVNSDGSLSVVQVLA